MPDRPARWAYRNAVRVESGQLALLRMDQMRGSLEKLIVASGDALDA